MKQNPDEKAFFRKYLLHDMDEEAQEQVEQRLITDKEFSRHIAMAQDDLIDDFIAGTLSEQEMESFRTHYMTTPARLQKLKFATALDAYVMKRAEEPPPGLFDRLALAFRPRSSKILYAVATALLICVAVILLLPSLRESGLWPGQNLQREIARINRAQETDATPLSELRRDSGSTRALFLRQNVVREGGEARRVEISGDVKLIRLLLEVESVPYDSYRAMMQTADGHDLTPIERLKARNEDGARFVVINLPAQLLARGDYQLRLTGIGGDGQEHDLGLYPFSLTTR